MGLVVVVLGLWGVDGFGCALARRERERERESSDGSRIFFFRGVSKKIHLK